MSASDTQPRSQQRIFCDLLAEQLQALRQEAGDPSYGEIARRISERRKADGASEHAARLARTTVFDTFRTGRLRVNLALVREIATVLGLDDEQVDGWVAQARAQAADEARAAQDTQDTGTERHDGPAHDPQEQPQAQPKDQQPVEQPVEQPVGPPRTSRVVLLLVGCVAVNLLGRVFVEFLHLPIYLDMVGTAVAAFALGPWWGAGVGATTNVLGVASSGPASVPFALVNVAGALAWGYGARRLGLARSLPRFLGLNLLAALVCTLVAVPILVLGYGGTTGHGQDTISATFLELTQALTVAVGAANLLVSVADKVISGFVALVMVSMLPLALRRGFRGPF